MLYIKQLIPARSGTEKIQFNGLVTIYSRTSETGLSKPDAPEFDSVSQTHVAAVQTNCKLQVDPDLQWHERLPPLRMYPYPINNKSTVKSKAKPKTQHGSKLGQFLLASVGAA